MVEIKLSIFDLTLDHILEYLQDMGQPQYRELQIWQGLYRQYWQSFNEFTNIPSKVRNLLMDKFEDSGIKPIEYTESRDSETFKTLFLLRDGKPIETVLMSYHDRQTVCVSTQSGCAMGCSFCATGQMGFHRHLSSGEMVEQVVFFARKLHASDKRISNIVFMGMGEPFHNYDAVMATIDRLNDPNGFNLGERHFTISTVGIIPQIVRFAKEKRQVNLAISLHSANDTIRSMLVPVNKKYPIGPLLDACREYLSITHRRITFEYALINNINDTPQHARELAIKIKGLLCHVNIIQLNPTNKFNGIGATRDHTRAFKEELDKYKIPCTVRLRRGVDISAGCGQLAAQDG